MSKVAKLLIDQFANEAFSVAFEDILSEYASDRDKVLRDARLSSNEPYLPALVSCEARKAERAMIACANAYVDALTTYGMAADHSIEQELRLKAMQIAGGAISCVQGEFELAMLGFGRRRKFPLDYVNREISARTNAALRKGLLNLKRQRIQFTHEFEHTLGSRTNPANVAGNLVQNTQEGASLRKPDAPKTPTRTDDDTSLRSIGRPAMQQTAQLHAAWTEKGKPKLTGAVCDDMARVFFPDDYAKSKPGTPGRKKLRDRVGNALRRMESRAATKLVS